MLADDHLLKARINSEEKLRAHSSLVHRVFVQNEDGAKLLDHWIKNIVQAPILTDDKTQFGAGIAEGKRIFVLHEIMKMIEIEV